MTSLLGHVIGVALAAAAMLSAARAAAQALPTATGPASTVQVGAGLSGYHIDYGQRWLGGPFAWANYNPWLHLGIEGEARSLHYNQDLGVHGSTFLVGPRIAFHRGSTEPYLKVLAGSGRLALPYAYAHGSYFVVAAGGGVDVDLGTVMKIRVIDFTYQQWPAFTFGTMTSFGASAGISVTLRRGETWRTEEH